MAPMAAPQSSFDIFESYWTRDGGKFQWETSEAFFTRHMPVMLFLAALYVPVQFYLRDVMKDDTKKRDIRWFVVPWNIALATFSLLGALHTVPQAIQLLANDGLAGVCNRGIYWTSTGYWVFWFDASKLFEFVDTVVLRIKKAPVPLLHWYHHIATSLYCMWANQHVAHSSAAGWYFAAMNLTVHSIMYTYFGVTAINKDIKARVVAMGVDKAITIIQLVQMVGGMFFLAASTPCQGPQPDPVGYWSGWAMYTSYLVLFGKLYVDKYLKAKEKRRAKKEEEAKAARSKGAKGVEAGVNGNATKATNGHAAANGSGKGSEASSTNGSERTNGHASNGTANGTVRSRKSTRQS